MRFSLPEMAARTRPRRRPITLPVITPTAALRDDLSRIYMRVVRAWLTGARDRLLPAYERALAQQAVRDSLIRDDAADLGSMLDSLGEELYRLVLELVPELRDWVVQVERWHRGRWTQGTLSATDVELSTMLGPEDVRESMEAILNWNVSLIRDVSDQARNRIASIVFEGLNTRRPAREVAKAISEAVGLSRDRSLRIAADQLSKLSSRLDEERQRQAGIEQFTWRHSGKKHPRSWHQHRDGKIYDWETRKQVGGDDVIERGDGPGEPPWCGCRAQAYISYDR